MTNHKGGWDLQFVDRAGWDSSPVLRNELLRRRGEERLPCLQAVKPGSCFHSEKRQIASLALKMERKNINRCLGGLGMEDQVERSPQTFLGNNFCSFSSFNPDENKTIGELSSVSFEYSSGIKAAAWTLENKNGNVQY